MYSKRMRFPGSVNREFLKKWLIALKTCTSLKRNMTFLERKKTIKLSCDIAMASLKTGTRNWSRALIANALDDEESKGVAEHLLGPEVTQKFMNMNKVSSSNGSTVKWHKRVVVCSKNLLRRRQRNAQKRKKMTRSIRDSRGDMAKRLVKKRTQVLKKLIPGGEDVADECTLMEETLDYVLSLKAQVDVMRRLAAAAPPQHRVEQNASNETKLSKGRNGYEYELISTLITSTNNANHS